MSLEALVAHILSEGEASAAETITRAEAQAAQIMAEARREADRIFAEAERTAAQNLPAELGRLRNQARFSALCISSQARDELVQQVVDGVTNRLAHIRADSGYPALLGSLLDELIPYHNNAKAPGEGWILEADPMDQPLIARLMSERGMAIPVDYCLDCWGGLNARAEDGSVTVLNTLESRLSRAATYLRQQLAAWVEAGFPSRT